jgi:cytochrome P450
LTGIAASEVSQSYPSPELLECPYPFFDRAREERPVYQDPVTGAFLVFRHEDIAVALQNDDIFSAVNGSIGYADALMISATDPPQHKVIRDLAYRPFTPGRLRSYEPLVTEYADALIDRFLDAGEVELVNEFAIPLPGLVICRLMGLPTEGEEFETILDRMSMRSTDARHRTLVTTGSGAARHSGSGIRDMHEDMSRAILARYENPTEDILSEIITRHVKQNGELDLPLLVTISTELLAGGLLTTAQMIANGMLLLLENPDQMEKVLAEPDRRIPWMLEETLRMESPVQTRERITTQDFELSGVLIPAGSPVLIIHASGNRDPRRFDDPERFDVDRSRKQLKQHFGFGLGRHFCLGAPLARMEGQIAFARLFARLSEIRLAPGKNDFRHIDFAHFRAVRELCLEFEPA